MGVKTRAVEGWEYTNRIPSVKELRKKNLQGDDLLRFRTEFSNWCRDHLVSVHGYCSTLPFFLKEDNAQKEAARMLDEKGWRVSFGPDPHNIIHMRIPLHPDTSFVSITPKDPLW